MKAAYWWVRRARREPYGLIVLAVLVTVTSAAMRFAFGYPWSNAAGAAIGVFLVAALAWAVERHEQQQRPR